MSFPRVAFSFRGKGNVSKAYTLMKNLSICNLFLRGEKELKKSKQIVKELLERKTKTAPN